MIAADDWLIYAGVAAAVVIAALTWIYFEFQYIHHKLRFLEGAVVARPLVHGNGSGDGGHVSIDPTLYAPLPPEEQEQEQEQDVMVNELTGEVLPLPPAVEPVPQTETQTNGYSDIPSVEPAQVDIATYLAPLEETQTKTIEVPADGLQQQQQQEKPSKRRQKKQQQQQQQTESIETALIVDKVQLQQQESQLQQQESQSQQPLEQEQSSLEISA
jgi:hypothetical protein